MRIRSRNAVAGSALVVALTTAAIASGSAGVAAPPPPPLTITVSGAVAKPAAWTVDTLRRAFAATVQPVKYTLKGHDHMATAVSLFAVVEQAEPRLNPHIKNHALQFVVEVQGRDGYTADFTLSEINPEIGARSVWLALDEDGAPLADEAAPAEIVSPDDRKPARWVHGVAAITVVNMAAVSYMAAAPAPPAAPPAHSAPAPGPAHEPL